MSIPLFLLSFNLAKLGLHDHDFAQALIEYLPDDPCDLYVFGFQELCSTLDGCSRLTVKRHLIKINLVLVHALKDKYETRENQFLFTTVGIHGEGTVGIIAITPFVLKFAMARFADASCGYAYNLTKGLVGLRIKYMCEDMSVIELTFGNAHLCANEGKGYYQRRLQDLQLVMRAMDFGDNFSFLKPNCHTFFMGDLNFRTSRAGKGAASAPELLLLSQDPQFDPSDPFIEQASTVSLAKKYDELIAGRENGEVFSGFEEPCISFVPTYKYKLGSADLDPERSPLWCDRILYQSTYRRGIAPEVHKYLSISSYQRSDHRPVYLHVSIPTEAPESIIDANGHLVFLPPAHLLTNPKKCQPIDSKIEVSGPTDTYMKCTPVDKIKQLLVRPTSNRILGTVLWLGSTSAGRLTSLLLLLLAAACSYLVSP